MRKLLFIILPILLMTSCRTTKNVETLRIVDSVYVHDSIWQKDTIRIIQRPDTIRVEVPRSYMSNSTRDTLSFLSDGIYKSSAWVKNGILHHTLQSMEGATRKVTTIRSDTTKISSSGNKNISKNVNKNTEVKYVDKPLKKWQKFMIWLSIIETLIIVGYIVYRIYR